MEETKVGVEFGKLKLTWNVENDDRYKSLLLKPRESHSKNILDAIW